jgi:hypothetical protein
MYTTDLTTLELESNPSLLGEKLATSHLICGTDGNCITGLFGTTLDFASWVTLTQTFVFSFTVTTTLLVTASNGGHYPFFGFPNSPVP